RQARAERWGHGRLLDPFFPRQLTGIPLSAVDLRQPGASALRATHAPYLTLHWLDVPDAARPLSRPTGWPPCPAPRLPDWTGSRRCRCRPPARHRLPAVRRTRRAAAAPPR